MKNLEDFLKLYGKQSDNNPDNITLDKKFIIAAEKVAAEFNYGEIIDKAWLLKEFDIVYPEFGNKKEFDNVNFEFLQNIESFKTYLLEKHQMFLVNIRGVGYQIMMPNQQSDFAMYRIGKIIEKEIKKAFDTLIHVNESKMSHDDIKKRDEHQGKIAALASFTKIKKIR